MLSGILPSKWNVDKMICHRCSKEKIEVFFSIDLHTILCPVHDDGSIHTGSRHNGSIHIDSIHDGSMHGDRMHDGQLCKHADSMHVEA